MKKYLLLLALLSVSLAGLGQEPEDPISLDGSISSDIGSGKNPNRNQNGFESTVAKQLPIGVRSWRIDEHLGRGDSCAVDTLVTISARPYSRNCFSTAHKRPASCSRTRTMYTQSMSKI